jgi:hypothetical protein
MLYGLLLRYPWSPLSAWKAPSLALILVLAGLYRIMSPIALYSAAPLHPVTSRP